MTKLTRYRIYEMIPGTLTWATLIGALLLSFISPLLAIYLIILFDLYWLLRVLYFVFYLFISWRRYRADVAIDWYARLQSFSHLAMQHGDDRRSWQDYYHLIFLPTYKEPLEVLESTFEGLMRTTYAHDKMIIVLAGEKRDEQQFQKHAMQLKKRYAQHFADFLVTVHPHNLPDEVPGKGSNLHWAGHEAQKLVDRMGISYEQVIVSAFDIDTVVHPQYFSYLTYRYMTHPNPTRSSFQPVALYNNNMWDSQALVRVASFGTTFWLMTELARPDRLFTFSSHSMSFQALVDVGFWEKRIVTEDSRIFLQCFLRYDGNYEVTPLYIPVSMHTVTVESRWRSLVNLYKQQRRWAWGVEHFPYMLHHFRHNHNIPWRKKIKYIWNLGEGMYSWATAPLLIFLLGQVPRLAVTPELESQILYQNAPAMLSILVNAAAVGILASAMVSLLLLPRRPEKKPTMVWLVMIFQWALLPVTLVFFGSIPAIDAQTRLMIGKPLGFWVTEKKKKATIMEHESHPHA
ncbi:MAG: glycosyltransferase family 2 protein [Candidatus Yonathbacteria bacterium]|nr:glycosyltransferase family 2 protein [Candidatus Yonathbacteria bacterium]